MYKIKYTLIALLFTQIAIGQIDTLLVEELEAVELVATKINANAQNIPLSISTYQAGKNHDTKSQLSLQEMLSHVPGLYSLNANNFAQDLRISIRGFGARAAFGIRGIKLVVDGIPETTPDGQGQLDNLNLSSISKIEVIKGPASSLYGNASGGVIHINTLSEFKKNFAELSTLFGSYGMQQYRLSAGMHSGSTKYIFQGNYTKTNGYRVQSGFKSTNVSGKIIHQFSEKSMLSISAQYMDSPQADDPGGINIEDATNDRRQARQRNVDFKTGETIDHSKFGLNYNFAPNDHSTFNTYTFYSARNFEGVLPFEFGGLVNLGRKYYGHGSHFSIKQISNSSVNEIQFGYDIANQADERNRFRNLQGTQGDQTLGQLESFRAISLFAIDHYHKENFFLTGSLRYDNNKLSIEDRFLSNGNDSGAQTLSAITAGIGISYKLNTKLNVYTNFRSSFETPSLSELTENPNGNSGFNEDVKAQRANNFELGIKTLSAQNLSFDLALFYIKTSNDLVPFELEAFPDRTFFRNAGTTKRMGAELAVAFKIKEDWNLTSSYTYSDFTYGTFVRNNEDFSDNNLPGIPKHFGAVGISKSSENGLHLSLDLRYSGSLFANDSNQTSVDAYTALNMNAGYQVKLSSFQLTPFFGINNLLNTLYFDNIRLNAFGRRYYEAAPERNIYGGIKVRF